MSRRYSDIALSALVITVPFLILSGVLLALVFNLRVVQEPSIFSQGQQNTLNEPGVYYVNISSTFLVFIASWSSSIVPMLATFMMTLASFPIANNVLKQSRLEKCTRSLTPYQFALALNFLSGGGYGAAWRWIKYLFMQREARERQAQALTQAPSFALLTLLLGLLVLLADTWLHVATKTVTFTQLQEPEDPPASHGFGLVEACTINNNSFADAISSPGHPCALNEAATSSMLVNGTHSLEVLNNVSSLATVPTITSEKDYVYLAVPPSAMLAKEDWRVGSFALQTQCRLASAECDMRGVNGASTPFHCSDAFHGDVTSNPQDFIWAFFTDGTMSDNDTSSGVENPSYFGMAALVNPNIGVRTVPGTVNPMHGGTAFVLLCNTTVLEVTYDSVNGTITNLQGVLSNASTVNVWQSAMAYTVVGIPNMKQAASLAAMGHSPQQFTEDMALSFSKTALAIGSQSVEERSPLAVQTRFSFLVARVPTAPLYALVGANMLVVFVTVALTIVALMTSTGDVKEVQSRLSIVGLVADRFEDKTARFVAKDLDELFRESQGKKTSRVGIDSAAEGGFGYKTWNEDR
ncbi:uncharacterized protein M437DRAFT_59500 [Aureobasidium melanogenum CBS 110374]|uniref:Uncharacterized protein n=1 Tax=Aureobasidium melanogenum (strain CBS 110374) TaxID=1043003 RepID=A0A074VL65_AURM1|nr:uncharacterized protein M437DRAFT_59500 [Aureobasidium melanogenum CBS 110374]KEQ58392.1 hypothetical protein M437DRAFT_59500 [Aureobasidium melanogenum CBS 110374]